MEQMVFLFNETKEGNTIAAQKKLGNKGAQLAEMTAIGLPVPRGFTVGSAACREYYSRGKKWPAGLEEQVKKKLKELEKQTGKILGDTQNPLLVSVRSGSYVSMPGMMDTILNLGLNDGVVVALAQKTSERTAWDSYRRFIQMFGNVVMKIKSEEFEKILEKMKKEQGATEDTELTAHDLRSVATQYKQVVREKAGRDFPQDPWEQLNLAITAVFASWNNQRAIAYRKINNLPGDAGTGVTVQEMVFGNLNDLSGTGVAFTRNPSTGKKEFFGEFLINAQGEDVVAGIRTPQPIRELEQALPEAFAELTKTYKLLEAHYRDVQDFEFTIENNRLFLLQTRTGKRTAQAAVKIAVDMVHEGLISKEEAVLRVKPEQLDQLLHKQLDAAAKETAQAIARGLPASPGAAVGKIVFSAEKAAELVAQDPQEKVILVRPETSPEDIEGMHAAAGILTSTGGITSHAAVVSRGMGKCCIAGCEAIKVNETNKTFIVGEKTFAEGDIISLDGSTGEVFAGELLLTDPQVAGEFAELMEWADAFRKLGVRTNADTPVDSQKAREFGAEGIGLCRTEHMFFDEKRIQAVREMILAETKEGRKKALEKILPFQKQDFLELFTIMEGLPVKIRLLDPPLHEFLPREKKAIEEIAAQLGVSVNQLREKIEGLHEFNPMLGFRGCRLGMVYPEINEMQARAIFEAALELVKEGKKVQPEIMVPLVSNENEMKRMKELIDSVGKKVMEKQGVTVEYEVGSMIELPSACTIADALAKYCSFFSFGTNDLTQTTMGLSRDDSGKFLTQYVEQGILSHDPFASIQEESVGELMKLAIEKIRKTDKNISIGICGEHGGDPKSIAFCHSIGIDYVSCSPYRVPIARLAAAHAALKQIHKQ